MLTPKLFSDYFFDDLNEMDHKLYGKHSNKEMLTDIKEHDDHYDIEVDLPGFHKDQINLALENGYLTVSAHKSIDENDTTSSGTLIRQEKTYGTLSRSFYVGEGIENSDIKARYEVTAGRFTSFAARDMISPASKANDNEISNVFIYSLLLHGTYSVIHLPVKCG